MAVEVRLGAASPVQSDPRQAIVRAVLAAVTPHLPA